MTEEKKKNASAEKTSKPKKKTIKKKIIIKKKIHVHKKNAEETKPGHPHSASRPASSRPAGQSGNRPAPAGKPKPSSAAEKRPATGTDKNKTTDKKPVGKKGKRYNHNDRKYSRFKDDFNLEDLKYHKHKDQQTSSIPKEIKITDSISVGELAKKLNLKANTLISKLMKLGVMATITDVIDSDTAVILCDEINVKVNITSLYEETLIKNEKEDDLDDQNQRDPIVTIMGHVDHGKTQLLDSLRKSNIIETEAGHITQHIGAYKVWVDHNKTKRGIVFLDTPGHEAFTSMRARGAETTDIVILVVAADDGIMEQTKEAISHAKNASVPIIVAVNKIDLPAANPEKVRQDLSNFGIVPEKWGGENIFVDISAKDGTNLDKLLDSILLVCEMLELKANKSKKAVGTVIESKIDPGLGAVSTVLIQNGTLHLGEPFVAGIFSGRVRSMVNEYGKKIDEAGPSTPVAIHGIDGVPFAGAPFQVVISEKYSKQISAKRKELRKFEEHRKIKKVTLDNFMEKVKDGEIKEMNLIVKADVKGSVEALEHSFQKLNSEYVRIRIVHSAAGGINENDVNLALTAQAVIIGFHVRPNPKALERARQENIEIRTYEVIYKAIEDIQKAMEGLLEPETKEEILGSVEIRDIFKYSKLGTIAGSFVTEGKVTRNSKARLVRDSIVIYTGDLSSLKRFKDDAKEVSAGMECGIMLENYNDLKQGDVLEIFIEKKEKRKLFS